MRITGLKLHNFRNYRDLEQAFEPGFTVFTGLNGAGKTNVLEAIFLCALGRSHRTSRDGELIRMGEMEAMVLLNLTTRGGSRSIREELTFGERKRIFLDGAPVARSGELMGCLNVVMFSPEDLILVKGGPAERRRFMDMEISQLKPAYYYDLQQYNQALKQRNNLLKEGMDTAGDMLELWDEQLSRLGARIEMERAAFCRDLRELAFELHDHMSSGREALSVEYEPNVPCGDEELIREAREYIRLSESRLPEREPQAYPIGQRVRHEIMGLGTVVDVDTGKGAHIVRFDELNTTRSISFRARLERAEP